MSPREIEGKLYQPRYVRRVRLSWWVHQHRLRWLARQGCWFEVHREMKRHWWGERRGRP